MSEIAVKEVTQCSLVPETLQIKHEGYRLIQMCATKNDQAVELLYSFGKEYDLLNLKMVLQDEAEVMSISNIFPPAFLYENEIHDLFGVDYKLISLDYQGNLYRTEIKTPFK